MHKKLIKTCFFLHKNIRPACMVNAKAVDRSLSTHHNVLCSTCTVYMYMYMYIFHTSGVVGLENDL